MTLGIGLIDEFSVADDMAVVLYDIVLGWAASDVDTASGSCIADDGYILTLVGAAVSVGHNVNGCNSTGRANIISFHEQAVDTAGLIDGDVAVALVVDDLAIEDAAIDVVLVH